MIAFMDFSFEHAFDIKERDFMIAYRVSIKWIELLGSYWLSLKRNRITEEWSKRFKIHATEIRENFITLTQTD